MGMALSHGNGSCGLIIVSGERAFVSSCSIMLLTRFGSLVILPVSGSRMVDRFDDAV